MRAVDLLFFVEVFRIIVPTSYALIESIAAF